MARQQSTTATMAQPQLAEPKVKLAFGDMPEAAVTANAQAVNARNWYQWTVAAEQILLITAAAAGAALIIVGANDMLRAVIVVALGAAFLVRALRTAVKPDAQWYALRSTAEDVQSAAWRYVMAVAPYDAPPGGDPLATADAAFVERCQEIWNKSALPNWQDSQAANQISPKMRQVRQLALPDRIIVYLTCRLADQRDWYRKRTNQYRRAGRVWNVLILIVEGAAGVATGVHFFGWPAIDLYGLATTVVAGIAVWTHVKQYSTLEQRYMRMARTLQSYIDVLTVGMSPEQVTPDGWSKLVNRTEQLMEQEHESWLTLYKGLQESQQPQPTWQEFEQQLAQSGVTLR